VFVLTLLSGIALLVLLLFLGWALSQIARSLEGVTESLEKICIGALNETFDGIAKDLASVEATLNHAVEAGQLREES